MDVSLQPAQAEPQPIAPSLETLEAYPEKQGATMRTKVVDFTCHIPNKEGTAIAASSTIKVLVGIDEHGTEILLPSAFDAIEAEKARMKTSQNEQ